MTFARKRQCSNLDQIITNYFKHQFVFFKTMDSAVVSKKRVQWPQLNTEANGYGETEAVLARP